MIKSIFDYSAATVILIVASPAIAIGWALAKWDTKASGFFIQSRIGRKGEKFNIIKLRTINPKSNQCSKTGKWLRESKWDELPQLINILKGEMSFVGPRPDIPGYYDALEGENRKILNLKPGITSEAAIKYANEEALLDKQENPKQFNDEVIFPDKIKMNLDYYHNQSFLLDIKIIWKTFFN